MKLILFDMDGTLLDTEKWYQEGWRLAAEQLGYPLSTEQRLEFRSLGRPFNRMRMKELFGAESAYDRLRGRRVEIMAPWFEERELPLKPGVKETLASLRERGYLTGVVTATAEEKTKVLLEKAGLLSYFDRIICAPMVERGKPAPDVYLYACRAFGITPSEAIAVEDAPNGVRSAAAAGCRVIMIPDLTQPDETLHSLLWMKADSMAEILEFLP